jgi:hypothetical protein
VTVAFTSPVPRPVTVRVAVLPFGPVTVEFTLPSPRVVLRVAVFPFGPVTVAFTSPVPRPITVRVAVLPFGPVTVEFTLPPPRVVLFVAVFPFGPVTVVLEVVCAAAVANETSRTAGKIQMLFFIRMPPDSFPFRMRAAVFLAAPASYKHGSTREFRVRV